MKKFLLALFNKLTSTKHYLYKLDRNYIADIPALEGVDYRNHWVSIVGGTIKINKGYAWDGCSPKINVLGLFNIGVPDGALRCGKPFTYHASLVHDVLCQFSDIPITKAQSVAAFNHELTNVKFPLTRLYVFAVNKFGKQKFNLD